MFVKVTGISRSDIAQSNVKGTSFELLMIENVNKKVKKINSDRIEE